jgi:hypothetical protein
VRNGEISQLEARYGEEIESQDKPLHAIVGLSPLQPQNTTQAYRNTLHNHIFLENEDSVLGNNHDALGKFQFFLCSLLFVRINARMTRALKNDIVICSRI